MNAVEISGEDMVILTPKELADRLKIGRDKAYALIKSSSFPSIQIGGRYRIINREPYHK